MEEKQEEGVDDSGESSQKWTWAHVALHPCMKPTGTILGCVCQGQAAPYWHYTVS